MGGGRWGPGRAALAFERARVPGMKAPTRILTEENEDSLCDDAHCLGPCSGAKAMTPTLSHVV